MKFNAIFNNISWQSVSGTDPGFQVRGAHLKKLRRAEGGAKMFGVFRVKNSSPHHPPPPPPPLNPPLSLVEVLVEETQVLNVIDDCTYSCTPNYHMITTTSPVYLYNPTKIHTISRLCFLVYHGNLIIVTGRFLVFAREVR